MPSSADEDFEPVRRRRHVRPSWEQESAVRRLPDVIGYGHDDAAVCRPRTSSATLRSSVNVHQAHTPDYPVPGGDAHRPLAKRVTPPTRTHEEALTTPVIPKLRALWPWQKREVAINRAVGSTVSQRSKVAQQAAERRQRLAERMRASTQIRIERLSRGNRTERDRLDPMLPISSRSTRAPPLH